MSAYVAVERHQIEMLEFAFRDVQPGQAITKQQLAWVEATIALGRRNPSRSKRYQNALESVIQLADMAANPVGPRSVALNLRRRLYQITRVAKVALDTSSPNPEADPS